MASYATRISELATAASSAGLTVRDTWGGEPPYVIVFNDGGEFGATPLGTYRQAFRITAVQSKALDSMSTSALAALMQTVLGVVLDLQGWRIDSLSADQLRDDAGSRVYSADVIASAIVEIA